MYRLIALLLILALLVPAPAHLEADASRSELRAGDTFSIDAHEFDTSGPITIAAPAGFDLLSADVSTGRALWRFRVADDAPKGLARFVVRAGGLSAEVVVRVGPVVWPPAYFRLYLPAARG